MISAKRKDVDKIRGLGLGTDDRRVFVRQKEVVLTTKEFALLLFLVKHTNKVFSKDHLFEEILGIDAFGNISTVTVHIRKLREKIEMDSSKPQYIETVWGAGYRMKVLRINNKKCVFGGGKP